MRISFLLCSQIKTNWSGRTWRRQGGTECFHLLTASLCVGWTYQLFKLFSKSCKVFLRLWIIFITRIFWPCRTELCTIQRLRTSEITSTTSSFLLPTAILVSISLCSSRQHGSDCNVRISSVLSIQIVTSQPPAGVDLVTACIYLAQLTAWIIYFQTWSTKVVLVKSGRNWRGDSEIRIVISASWSLNSGGQGCDPLESESDTFLTSSSDLIDSSKLPPLLLPNHRE